MGLGSFGISGLAGFREEDLLGIGR
jgi:hypothetical protein